MATDEDASEDRIARIYSESTPEVKELLDRHRAILSDPVLLALLEKAPKPLSRDQLIDAVTETLSRES
jgi:hypothetical protein